MWTRPFSPRYHTIISEPDMAAVISYTASRPNFRWFTYQRNLPDKNLYDSPSFPGSFFIGLSQIPMFSFPSHLSLYSCCTVVVPLSDVLTTESSYRPERWAAPPQEARAIPGLYSNTLTFLNGNPLGGNRACIGYKFALIE